MATARAVSRGAIWDRPKGLRRGIEKGRALASAGEASASRGEALYAVRAVAFDPQHGGMDDWSALEVARRNLDWDVVDARLDTVAPGTEAEGNGGGHGAGDGGCFRAEV